MGLKMCRHLQVCVYVNLSSPLCCAWAQEAILLIGQPACQAIAGNVNAPAGEVTGVITLDPGKIETMQKYQNICNIMELHISLMPDHHHHDIYLTISARLCALCRLNLISLLTRKEVST